MKTQKYYTPEEISKAAEMWAGGNTMKQIAIELGRSTEAIKSFVSNHREKFPPNNNSGRYARDKALEALQTYPDFASACAYLQWNPVTVDRWARLFVKTGQLSKLPEGIIYRRNYHADPEISDLARHLANRLNIYKARGKYKNGELYNSFDLDVQWVQEQLQRQNNKCYYTGAKFSMIKGSRQYITVDRVDSNLGYSRSNCVLCCHAVNSAKNSMPVDKFIIMCHAVARKHPI